MSLDSVGGGVSVQNPTDISQGGVDQSSSVTSKAFSRSVSVESDVESTQGLRTDKPKSEFPTLRERITTPVDSSKTRSIRKLAGQLAGNVANKVVPDRLQEGASSLKAKASKKAQAAFEFVSEKATALKSVTIGKLLRAIRSESWSKVDTQVRTPELQSKIDEHNQGVEKLADLKTQLKNEETGLKEFESQYKEALELLEHSEKFTASAKPRMIETPAGQRTINAGDLATREKMVDMIKQDIMDTPEYQQYEYGRAQQKSGGTELFAERQNLKKEMKTRAEGMVELFKAEVADDLEVQKGNVQKRRGDLKDAQLQKAAGIGSQYEQKTEEARALKEAKEKAVTDLKEERTATKEVIQDARKKKSQHKSDAAYFREAATHMRDGTNRSKAVRDATAAQNEYERLKDGVGQAKKRVSEIPADLKTERKERKEARKAVEDLESGKARKKENKEITTEWETEEKKLSKEEKQLDKRAKERTSNFKKGLG